MTKTNRGSGGPVATIAEYEAEQVNRANSTGRQPVVFVHGLWLLPSSWDRWANLFEEAGYTALTPGWPDDPETVEEAQQHPEVFAGKTSGEKDHTVPPAIANAAYKKQQRNRGVTEIVEMPNRGHALVIDSGWRQVADTALAFVQRFVSPGGTIRADSRAAALA